MFDIYLTDQSVPEGDPGAHALYGKIRIGDHSETFIANLLFWNRKQYEEHWLMAVKRVVEGADRSALVTSYNEPSPVPDEFLNWWPLYRDREAAYIQNQMLFFDQLGPALFRGRSVGLCSGEAHCRRGRPSYFGVDRRSTAWEIFSNVERCPLSDRRWLVRFEMWSPSSIGSEQHTFTTRSQIDPAWKDREYWIRGGVRALSMAVAARGRSAPGLTVALAFSLVSGPERRGADFNSRAELQERLDWSPPSLYLFRKGQEPWRLLRNWSLDGLTGREVDKPKAEILCALS
jgi:CdiI N-terminal domain